MTRRQCGNAAVTFLILVSAVAVAAIAINALLSDAVEDQTCEMEFFEGTSC